MTYLLWLLVVVGIFNTVVAIIVGLDAPSTKGERIASALYTMSIALYAAMLLGVKQ